MVAGYEPQFGPRGGVPFTGELQLNFNDGIISGWYRDTSIRPGAPLSNRFREPVSGGTSGSNIHFGIGTGTRAFSVTGTIDEFGSISGSARSRGSSRTGSQIWAFQAMARN